MPGTDEATRLTIERTCASESARPGWSLRITEADGAAWSRTNTECYRIDKHSFETILLARPALANDLAQIISEREQEVNAVLQGKADPDVPAEDANQANILKRIRQFFQLPM